MTDDRVDETLDEKRARKDAERDALERAAREKLPELLAAAYVGGRFFEEHGKKKWRSDAHDVTVNLARGRWRTGDEGTGKKSQDLVELIKLVRGDVSVREAARWVRDKLKRYGVTPQVKREYRRARWPVPEGHRAPWHKKGLQVDSPDFWARFSVARSHKFIRLWTYPGPEEPHFYVARFESEAGDKTFRQLAWFGEGEGWGLVTRASALGREPLPLGYYELARRPDAPVLVVEGEKTWDAATALLPDHVVLTWVGGTAAVLETDWSGLLGRHIKVFPDQDPPGRAAMARLQAHLYQQGNATVAPVDTTGWGLPPTWKDLADGDPAPGLPLAEVVDRIRQMSALPADLRYVHERVALVGTLTGDPFYLITEQDPVTGRAVRVRLNQLSRLRELYAHVPSYVPDNNPKNPPRRTNAVDKWLAYGGKRIFARTYLDPGRAHDDCYLNLWEGYTARGLERHQLIYTGLDPRVLTLLRDTLCPDDPAMARYLVRYLAHLVQYPTRACDVALVLVGLEGTGKTFFSDMVRAFFHPNHGITYGHHDQATSNFNDELEDKLVVVYDEALYGRKKGDQDYLNTLITGRELTVEGKGQARRKVPNHLHVLVLSNNEAPVRATREARRYAVLRTSDRFAGPGNRRAAAVHFAELHRLLYEEGQLEQLVAWLLRLPVAKFKPTEIPDTEGLRQAKAGREDPVLDFLVSRLSAGNWAEEVELVKFHEDFCRYCELTRARQQGINGFAHELRRLLPPTEAETPEGRSVGVQRKFLKSGCYQRSSGHGVVANFRRFPPQATAVARLALYAGVTPAELGLEGLETVEEEPAAAPQEIPF